MNSKKLEILNTQNVLSMKGEGYYSQKTAGAKNAMTPYRKFWKDL